MRKFCGLLLASVVIAGLGVSPPALAQTEYKYDAAGRLIRVKVASGPTVVYGYDQAGNRTLKFVSLTNQAPVAVDDAITVEQSVNYDFDPRTNDSDPEIGDLTITAKTNGAKGTVTILNGGTQLRYSPNAGALGADSFTYTIEDPEGAADTATVNVTIVNSPPNAVSNSFSNLNRGKTYYLNVVANDTDPNGDQLEITSVSNIDYAGPMSVWDQTRVKLVVTNSCNTEEGQYSYTISDGHGNSDSATIDVSIAPFSGGCTPN